MRTRRIHSSSNSMPERHRPVLLHEVLDWLAITEGQVIIDATVGSAGHSKAIAELLGERGTLIGFDADPEAIKDAQSVLHEVTPRVILLNKNFRHVKEAVKAEGIKTVNAVLFDLGWRSEQLEGRGMSFMRDEPLLMTFDASAVDAITARDIVNSWDRERLADLIYEYGEEHFSRHIAGAITARRREKPIETTFELCDVIWHAVPVWYRRRRIHPATKTFQALRIAVNDEINTLTEGLAGAHKLLASGGRIAVVTFHSIEDRIVKKYFKSLEAEEKGKVLTPKPVTPSKKEIASNPRSRSAKLRVFRKTGSERSERP